MNQSVQSGNKSNLHHYLGRYSSTSNDENSHSINNGIPLSLQAFVDDIPFEFNHKYRQIIVVSYSKESISFCFEISLCF